MRHSILSYLGALALVASFLVGNPGNSADAAEKHSKGFAGVVAVEGTSGSGAIGVPIVEESAEDPSGFRFKSSITPITPVVNVFANVTVYNAGEGVFDGWLKVNVTPIRRADPVFYFYMHLDPGGYGSVPITRNNVIVEANVTLDSNNDTIVNTGDRLVGYAGGRVTNAVVRKHDGVKPSFDVIVNGTRPVTTTPNPQVLYQNGEAIIVAPTGKYLVSANVGGVLFTFPPPTGNDAPPFFGRIQPQFMSQYGLYNRAVSVTANLSDGSQSTSVMTMPTDSNSPAAVWTIVFTSPGQNLWRSSINDQGEFVYYSAVGTYGQMVTLNPRLVSTSDQGASPVITDNSTYTITAPASASAPSVFIGTDGVAVAAPSGHTLGEFGVILNTPNRQIKEISLNGGSPQSFWAAQ